MKTLGIGLAIAVATCLVAAAPAWAVFVPTRYEARWTSAPPVIDGNLDDAAWAGAEVIGDFYAYESGGDPAPALSEGRLLWDSDWLYWSAASRVSNCATS